VGGHEYSRAAVVKGLAYLDALAMLGWVVAVLWLSWKESQEADHIDRHVCTAADYTVKITGLPSTKDDAKLSEDLGLYLIRVLEAWPGVHVNGTSIGIADINIVYSDVEQIHLLQARGTLARKIDKFRNQIQLRVNYTEASPAWIKKKKLQIKVSKGSMTVR